jgi:hypothetical protein
LFKHRQASVPLLLSTVPLLALSAMGAVYHKDVLWMMRWSTENLLTSQSSLPVFDGIVGSLITGGLAKGVKGLLALCIFLLAVVCAILCYRRRFWIGMSIALGLIIMGVIVNQLEIWALVRFSSVLLLPLGYLLLTRNSDFVRRWGGLTPARFWILFAGAVACNAAFGYYMARRFFAP